MCKIVLSIYCYNSF